MSTTPKTAKSIFLEAVEKHQPDQWHAFLAGACGDDADLRGRVEELLRSHREADSLLDQVDATVDLPRGELEAGTVIGRYRLMEQIGEGGMGAVFVAEQQKPLRRKVALKVIKPGMDTKAVIARFEAERQALAMMDHPNIAKVLDAGTTQAGRPFFVMELVKGQPITEYCDEKKLTVPERLQLFIQVCQAIQHAHQKAIIHRDIKPSNVLVTERDGQAIPVVIDFGVAKALNQSLTERTLYTSFQSVIGTPLYMSPEQAKLSAVDVDTRSDVYSLGVLLYELLVGVTPFEKDRLAEAAMEEACRIIREEEPPRPSGRISSLGETATTMSADRRSDPRSLQLAVSGDLDWIVMTAIDKERSRRYETSNALADDVTRYLNNEPVRARPPSAAYLLSKFTRRNSGAILTGSAVLLLLVVGVVSLSYQTQRLATKTRELAEQTKKLTDEGKRARTAEEEARQNEKAANDALKKSEVLLRKAQILYLDRALIFAMNGKHQPAEEAVRDAIDAGLSPVWSDVVAGHSRVWAGKLDQSVAFFQAAAEDDPDNYAAQASLAAAKSVVRRGWREGIPGQPLTSEDYLFMALNEAWVVPREAAMLLEKADEWKGTTFEKFVRYVVYVNKSIAEGDYDDAVKAWEAAEEVGYAIRDESVGLTNRLYVRLAMIHALFREDRNAEAERLLPEARLLSRSLGEHSHAVFAVRTRSWFLWDFGDKEEAVESWKQLVLNDPQQNDSMFYAANCYRIGLEGEGLKTLKENKSSNLHNVVAQAYLLAIDPTASERVESMCIEIVEANRTPEAYCAVLGPLLLSGATPRARKLASQALKDFADETPKDIELILQCVANPEDGEMRQIQYRSLHQLNFWYDPTFFVALSNWNSDRDMARTLLRQCVARRLHTADWYWWSQALLERSSAE